MYKIKQNWNLLVKKSSLSAMINQPVNPTKKKRKFNP